MVKKTAAQIRRQIKRAQARGETYIPQESLPTQNGDTCCKETTSPIAVNHENQNVSSEKQPKKQKTIGNDSNNTKLKAYEKMNQSMNDITQDSTLDARSRRSAKRKAEAIAVQESGCSITELTEWHENYLNSQSTKRTKNDPYILFIGQLSFQSTSDSIFRHIQNNLGDKITPETLKIRLLNQDGKSKGMAFAEFTDPELMYQALSLHHTPLDGRRINVERSVGGRKNSETRKVKLQLRRKEQADYVTQTVDKILQEYRERGQLEEDELDEGVKALCYRRSPAIVEAALTEYVEARGTTLENPSAYLSRIICRITEEGIDSNNDEKTDRKKRVPSNLKRSFQSRSSRGN